MIHFRDASSITNEEAAVLMETEGRLGRGRSIDNNGLRCGAGVLVHSGELGRWPFLEKPSAVVGPNDAFDGTPEERCTHMAAFFRSLPEDIA
jgi:hypothetical protein